MLVAFGCFNLLLSVLSEFSIFQICLRQLNYYICSLVSVSCDSMFLWESFCSFFNNLKLPLIVDLYNFAAQLWEIQLHKWYVIQILLITTEMSWAVLLMSFYQLNILLHLPLSACCSSSTSLLCESFFLSFIVTDYFQTSLSVVLHYDLAMVWSPVPEVIDLSVGECDS